MLAATFLALSVSVSEVSAQPATNRFIELTGDPWLDILSIDRDGQLAIQVSLGGKQFEQVPQELPRVIARDILVSDLDGDGHPDLYLLAPGPNVALLGDGAGRFRDATEQLGLLESGRGIGAERVDVNGDGMADLLVHNEYTDVLFWAREGGVFERAELTPAGSAAGIPFASVNEEPDADGAPASGESGGSGLPGMPGAGVDGRTPGRTDRDGDDSVQTAIGGSSALPPLGSLAPDVPSGTQGAGSLDARYVNDDAGEVDSLDIVDGSLLGADVSTMSGNVTHTGGRLGVGTLTPSADFHVAGEGAVLAEGAEFVGLIPREGAGTRFMWFPGKAAIRAGRVLADEWDDAKVGRLSTAFGLSSEASGFGSTIGGGTDNRVAGGLATVSGGAQNVASADKASIGGGSFNLAGGVNASLGGGYFNVANGFASTVAGGFNNDVQTIGGSIGGGRYNSVGTMGYFAVISGGEYNTASAGNAVIGGGYSNGASANYATVAGGWSNSASGYGSAIGGGLFNGATGTFAVIGGGFDNDAGSDATVAGGNSNNASGFTATIGGGTGNTASGFYSTVAGGRSSDVSAPDATIGGGRNNSINDAGYGTLSYQPDGATIAGGQDNEIFPTTPYLNADFATVSGGRANTASGLGCTVGGGSNNTAGAWFDTVSGGAGNSAVGDFSTVGGGQSNGAGYKATVGGGFSNSAIGYASAIGGGGSNTATSSFAAIAGGYGNSAINIGSSVGGGTDNAALGGHSTVAGGQENQAVGDFSFAAGRRAVATHNGAFVWGDSQAGTKQSPGPDSFTVFACGGSRFFTNAQATSGVGLAPGSGTWSSLSDRDMKENFEPVDAEHVLSQVEAMPILEWNYRSQDAAVRHMGPTAQDFRAAFGLGVSEKLIDAIDPDGVALAAIQGLARRNRDLEQRAQANEQLIAALEARLTELER